MFYRENRTAMPADSICPLIHEDFPCQVLSLLHTLLDEVKTLHQTLENQDLELKTVHRAAHSHVHVSSLVIALQLEHPDRIWTSDTLAEEIGCSGAAVRKTKAWKEYHKRLEQEKIERSRQKRC